MSTWVCPLCTRRCAYGTLGCDDPRQCAEPPNAHKAYYLRTYYTDASRESVPGVGISEIANTEMESEA